MNFKDIDEARKILELGETASLREIRDAYRRLVLEHHPDRSGSAAGKESRKMFRKITAAFETLMEYCAGYRYSFNKKDVQDVSGVEMDEDHLRNFYDGWLVDFEKEGK